MYHFKGGQTCASIAEIESKTLKFGGQIPGSKEAEMAVVSLVTI